MPDAARARASAAITRLALDHPRYRSAACIAAYCSFGSEFDTTAFIADTLSTGKRLLLPRVDAASKTLIFYQVVDPAAELVAGVWGIREPDPARCLRVEPTAAHFVLVPGVAFTRSGERLGYGGGFYDGVLAKLPWLAFKVAAAFSVQLVDTLPVADWDCRVDEVVTDWKFGVAG